MSDLKCAQMLLGAADRDLLTLRGMSADVPQESFGFHVQQAAEKALKAWLALLGETYPLTHNVQALVDLLRQRDIAVETFDELVEFTPYAVELRYGGLGPDAESVDRAAAIALVETLLERVGRELQGPAAPHPSTTG